MMRAMMVGALAAVTLAVSEGQAATVTYDFSGQIGHAEDPSGEFSDGMKYTGRVTLDTEALATDISGQGGSVEVAYYSAVTDWFVDFKHGSSFSGDYGSVVLGNDVPYPSQPVHLVDRLVVTMYGEPDEPLASGRTLRFFQVDLFDGMVYPTDSGPFADLLESEEIPLDANSDKAVLRSGRLFVGDDQLPLITTSFERRQLPGCEASGGQPQKCDDLPSPVPLPASIWLFGAALAGLGLASRRR